MSLLHEAVANPEIAKMTAVAAAEVFSYGVATVFYNHCEMTHESVKLGRAAKLGSRVVNWLYGTVPHRWATSHLDHHRSTDFNEGVLLQAADALEYHASNPDEDLPVVPETFDKLDPLTDFTPDQVRHIGGLIRGREGVAGRYDPKSSYTYDEMDNIYNPEEPAYLYPRRPRGPLLRLLTGQKKPEVEKPEPRSLEAIMPELVDPHSPLLHRMGAWGIQFDGLRQFKKSQDHYREREERGELPDGDKLDRKLFNKSKYGIVAGYAGTTAIMGALLSESTLSRAVTHGSAVYFGGALFLIAASNSVNAWGHAGADLFKAAINKLKPKPDGTVTSKASRFLRWLTFDEASNQEEHHEGPWLRAFTWAKGLKKLTQAPTGTVRDYLARHNILMSKGDQFGNPAVEETNDRLTGTGELRPDMPSLALVEAQKIREVQLSKEEDEDILLAA